MKWTIKYTCTVCCLFLQNWFTLQGIWKPLPLLILALQSWSHSSVQKIPEKWGISWFSLFSSQCSSLKLVYFCRIWQSLTLNVATSNFCVFNVFSCRMHPFLKSLLQLFSRWQKLLTDTLFAYWLWLRNPICASKILSHLTPVSVNGNLHWQACKNTEFLQFWNYWPTSMLWKIENIRLTCLVVAVWIEFFRILWHLLW